MGCVLELAEAAVGKAVEESSEVVIRGLADSDYAYFGYFIGMYLKDN